MDVEDTVGLLVRHPWVRRRKLSVADYHRMGEVGILQQDERVELIEGEIVRMAPIGSGHSGTVNGFTRQLVMAAGEQAVVSVQNPIRLDNHNEPEPDFALLRPRADFYRHAAPRPADVLLLIEVAQSSLSYDRSVKLALYARHAIPEVWIVDVAAGAVEIWRSPDGDRYVDASRAARDAVLEPSLLPGIRVALTGLLG